MNIRWKVKRKFLIVSTYNVPFSFINTFECFLILSVFKSFLNIFVVDNLFL